MYDRKLSHQTYLKKFHVELLGMKIFDTETQRITPTADYT